MASRASPQPAFVLHHWDWSETSLILDLFTRDRGRVAVVAKGAKRPYSQLRPVLMPFQRLLVLTGKARAEEGADILTLRSAEYAGGGRALPSMRLFAGFYLNELLMKLLARADPHERLFDAYAQTLQTLSLGDEEPALRAFELVLLRETGVLPALGLTTSTQLPVQPGRAYQLQAEAGLCPTAAPGSVDGEVWLALQLALDRDDLDALAQAASSALAPLKPQLRALLAYHLGASVLRTRQLMQDVRRLLDPPPLAPPTMNDTGAAAPLPVDTGPP